MKKLLLLCCFLPVVAACDPPKGTLAELSAEKQLIAYESLVQLKNKVMELELLTQYWVLTPGPGEDKLRLVKLVDNSGAATRKMMDEIQAARKEHALPPLDLDKLLASYDSCLAAAREVMSTLKNVESYDDPALVFPARALVTDDDSPMRVHARLTKDLLDKAIATVREELMKQLKK